MLQWEWYDDANTFRLFMHLLLKANFEPSRYRGHSIPVGALVTGRKKLSVKLKLSEQQIRTSMEKLRETGEITSQATHDFSIISIVKWNDYQGGNQQITSKQPASNQQATTSKEGNKEITKEKKAALPDFISKKTWSDVKSHRVKIKKPMNTRAEQLMLGKLELIHAARIDIDSAVDMMVDKGWASICVEWYKNEMSKRGVVDSAVVEVYDPLREDLTNLREMQEEGTALFANGKPIVLDGNQFHRTDLDNAPSLNAYAFLKGGNTINSGVAI